MLLKTARSGLRQRVIAAAAAFSGSIAAYCLGVGAVSGARGPLCGFLAGGMAAAALVRAARVSRPDPGPVRFCPRLRLLVCDGGDGEVPLHPIGIARSLICLVRADGRGRCTIWRDSVAPEQFRRIAALGLWRRSAATGPVEGLELELISRKAVTEGQSVPRAGSSRDP